MKELYKNILISLETKGLPINPDNYSDEFYRQAKKLNINLSKFKIKNTNYDLLSSNEQKILNDDSCTNQDIIDILSKRIDKRDLSRFLNHFENFLKPSVNQDIYSEIEDLVLYLSKNPEDIVKDEIIETIEKLTQKRINLDRLSLKEKSEDMKKLLSLICKHYDKSLIQSSNSYDEVHEIKQEIDSLHLSEQSEREIIDLKAKLADTIFKLENSIEKNKLELVQGIAHSKSLQDKIENLQKELQSLQKEKNIDFLTGVTNRRGYNTSVLKIENEFNLFDSNYAIVFYDIDNFKSINDIYGHECGDIILNTFASILNRLTRVNDVISRYGGEEFVALVHYKHEDEITRYIKRVKEIINNNKFVYNNEVKLNVKFSAGVTFRNKYESYEQAIKKADKLLYTAKKTGKDRIIFDNDLVYV